MRMKFPTYDEMAKDVAEKALDEYLVNDKTLREWITIIFESAGKYEKHIDHKDCIWYGSDGGCPVTCSQYRDGWNDAMDYIFKDGKGYQPYRREI